MEWVRLWLISHARKLLRDGFILLALVPLLSLVSVYDVILGLMFNMMALLVFLQGYIWLHQASTVLNDIMPWVGEPLHKAVKYYGLSFGLIVLSPFLGLLAFILIIAALVLLAASLYNLYLYTAWIEVGLDKQHYSNIVIALLIIGSILTIDILPLTLQILGALLKAAGFASLAIASNKLLQIKISER